MKIILIAEHDGYNLAIRNLAAELIGKQHEVTVYAQLANSNYLYMFQDMNVTLRPVVELNASVLEGADAVFARNSFLLERGLIHIHTYVYSFSDNVFHEYTSASDFVFSIGEKWKREAPDVYEKNCVLMETGYLKLDGDSGLPREGNTLLFIDSGDYPFGSEGKEKLAELLIGICHAYPEDKLVIKPRFLPDDICTTHRNCNHLYANIDRLCDGCIPKNMTLLQQHVCLGEMIKQSDVVLCMYTTAYLEAALYEKELIIIDELPNEDNYNVRISTFIQPVREILKSSGCLVHYDEVIRRLPHGLQCSQRHLDQQAYSRGPVADKMADMISYVHEHFTAKGRFPRDGTYRYDCFKEEMKPDDTVTYETLVCRRVINCLRFLAGTIKRNLGMIADKEIDRAIEAICTDYSIKSATAQRDYKKLAEKIMDVFIDNRSLLPQDPISRSYLIYLLVVRKRTKEAVREEETGVCGHIVQYARGWMNFQDGKMAQALDCYRQYLQLVEGNAHDVTVADLLKTRAYGACILAYPKGAARGQQEAWLCRMEAGVFRDIAGAVMRGEMLLEQARLLYCRANIHAVG